MNINKEANIMAKKDGNNGGLWGVILAIAVAVGLFYLGLVLTR